MVVIKRVDCIEKSWVTKASNQIGIAGNCKNIEQMISITHTNGQKLSQL